MKELEKLIKEITDLMKETTIVLEKSRQSEIKDYKETKELLEGLQ